MNVLPCIEKAMCAFSIVIVSLFYSCAEPREKSTEKNPIAYDTPKDMHKVEVHFPPAAGEEVFRSGCITCHSLRYIEMQPDFQRKTWEKIVDKMRHSFGAPISDSSAVVIVNYLVAVKGKK
jgi:hypothetical protein